MPFCSLYERSSNALSAGNSERTRDARRRAGRQISGDTPGSPRDAEYVRYLRGSTAGRYSGEGPNALGCIAQGSAPQRIVRMGSLQSSLSPV